VKDLLSFGEVMIRLSPPGYQRLEQTTLLEAHVGGTELNVAIGAGRLGLDTAYITRLPDNSLGRMARNKIREQGVDVSRILWSSDDRMGLYFVEAGTNPRGGDLIYDRADSAICRMDPASIDWDAVFLDVKHYHVTGITPALSAACAQATTDSIRAAKKAGVTVSFDINYRAKLWSEDAARACLTPLLSQVDILFSSVGEMKQIFAITGTDVREVAANIEKSFGIPIIGLMRSDKHSVLRMAWRAVAYADNVLYEDIPIEVEIADRIGGGDAFAAGFLYAYLKKDHDVETALKYGNATAALKYTNTGDFSWSTLAEVEGLIRGKGGLAMKR
jgi:2-dehydro-3-deoxygluconokinase